MSGASSLGKDFSSGVQTYFDSINARGGVKGRRLRLLQLDDSGRAAEAAANVERLVGEYDLDLLIGPTNEGTLRSVTALSRLRALPLAIVGSPTGAMLDGAGEGVRVFTLRASYRDEARLLFDSLRTFASDHIALVVGDGPDSQSSALAARSEARARGVALAFDGDSSRWLQLPNKTYFGAVILAGDAVGTATALRALRRSAPHTPVFAFSSVDHRTLQELLGTTSRGVMLSQVMPPPGKTVHPFQREHRAIMKQNRDEPPSQHTLEGYVVARVIVAALDRVEGEPSGNKVLAAIRTLPTEAFGPMRVRLSYADDEARPRFVDLSAISSRGGLIE